MTTPSVWVAAVPRRLRRPECGDVPSTSATHTDKKQERNEATRVSGLTSSSCLRGGAGAGLQLPPLPLTASAWWTDTVPWRQAQTRRREQERSRKGRQSREDQML